MSLFLTRRHAMFLAYSVFLACPAILACPARPLLSYISSRLIISSRLVVHLTVFRKNFREPTLSVTPSRLGRVRNKSLNRKRTRDNPSQFAHVLNGSGSHRLDKQIADGGGLGRTAKDESS